jgi:hypothetical protein
MNAYNVSVRSNAILPHASEQSLTPVSILKRNPEQINIRPNEEPECSECVKLIASKLGNDNEVSPFRTSYDNKFLRTADSNVLTRRRFALLPSKLQVWHK